MRLFPSLAGPLSGRFDKVPPDQDLAVRDGDCFIPVEIRRNAKARRMTLRLDSHNDQAVLTVPTGTGMRRMRAFLEEHRGWLIDTFRALPPRIPFRHGVDLPFLGGTVTIFHDPAHRGKCRVEEDILLVGGDAPHVPRRVRDHLKTEARREISAQVGVLTDRTGLKAGRITVRDQVSRWGSCAANGNLSFNWRLICAKPDILTYVVAHEVAHLRHMNHSPAFWSLTEELAPGSRKARAWLREHGAALHRIG